MASETRRGRDEKRGAPSGPPRRGSCCFCTETIEDVDWKDHTLPRRFMSDGGKIRSRRVTGSCRRHQIQVGGAIKRAREMALLPGVTR
ncbi:MAG TPA: 30S ribosomal protein S18 [Thermoleophilia bacterium]|nr:30S ribosomal protein S18 [Thermoleophilia bacterium]